MVGMTSMDRLASTASGAPGIDEIIERWGTEQLSDEDVRWLRDRLLELRAILAPLLDDPMKLDSCYDGDVSYACVFCEASDFYGISQNHDADCPVLRKDTLLGR